MASLDATVTVEVLNAHQIESLAAALEDAQAEITRLSISPPPDGTVLVLRCCDKDGRSHGGFQWPESGPVECADWSALAVCGQGLHGWLWGEGDVSCSSIHGDPESRWYVVEVSAADVVDLGGKVKFPRGVVAFSGARVEAVAYLAARSPAGNRTIYGTATAGDAGTATAGYAGTATAGVRGTATAGDAGTATAGDAGTATAGDAGTATAGVRGTATAGVRGTATAGYAGTATAGYAGTATAGVRGTATAGVRGTATAGVRGTATAGDAGTATAGYAGTATAGYAGTATAGDAGTATAGDAGTATAGVRGTATAGDAGTIAIRYYDPKRDKYRVAIAEVGENGIEPNTAYVLDADHRFVKKTDAHRDSLQVKASLQDLGGEG